LTGGLPHQDFRSFHNSRRSSPARHIIDGDLLETFVDIAQGGDSGKAGARAQDQQQGMTLAAQIVRQLNDILNSADQPDKHDSTRAPTSVLFAHRTLKANYTVEDVLIRIEDMISLR
jgi:hypothetical protein